MLRRLLRALLLRPRPLPWHLDDALDPEVAEHLRQRWDRP